MKTPLIIAAAACLAFGVAAPAHAVEPQTSTTVSVTDKQVRVVVDGVEIIIDTSVEGKPVVRTPDAVTTPEQPPSEPPAAAPAESVADQIVRLTNEERAKEGLPAYTVEPCLMQSAQEVSETMAAENLMEHSDLSGIKACDLRGGENIAEGYETAAEVMAGWMGSTEGHREAILSPTDDLIGVGVVVKDGVPWYTQHFAEKKTEGKETV